MVWWRFKKHKLAVVSTFVVILIAIVAIIPGFFSTQDPHESVSTELFIPPQRLHFFDEGRLQLFVLLLKVFAIRRHCAWSGRPAAEEKIYLQLFAQGYTYKILESFRN